MVFYVPLCKLTLKGVMMFWPWQKLLSINDLEPQLINIKIDTPQIDIRSKIKTLIIDDKKWGCPR